MTEYPCPCCGGSGVQQWPPNTRPVCPTMFDLLDPRPAATLRRFAYLQRVAFSRTILTEPPQE